MKAMTIRCANCGAPNSGHKERCDFCGAAIIHALGGLGLLRAGNPLLDKAFLHFRKRLKRDPDDPDAHFGLAAYYVKRELYKEANAHLRKALHLAPIAGEVHYLKAWTIALWRGWTNILIKQHALRATRLNPQMKEAKSLLNIYRGVMRTRTSRGRDDLRAALKFFQKSKDMRIHDHMQYVYFFCAEALERAGEDDSALKMLRAARDFGYKDPLIHIRMGMVYKKKKQFKLALQEFKKALKLDPGNRAVHRTISAIKLKLSAKSSWW